MIVNCPQSCQACDLLDPKLRCNRDSLNISASQAFAVDEMNKMFERVEEQFGDKYGITVVSTSPWIVTFENFLTDKEIDALIATNQQWERSTDTGDVNAFGETGRVLSQGRTSSNSWCRGECESHPDVVSIMKKIEEVTTVPTGNYESFQVLRYELGQKYSPHHDMSESQTRLACGPRVLTFFLYLSDVEEGGETAFPVLDVKIQPKKGMGLLWPSTLSEAPESIDKRTTHEAKPVIQGQKYAANTWIHQYDYRVPNLWGKFADELSSIYMRVC
jgi:prolyl 4-hydroxylase